MINHDVVEARLRKDEGYETLVYEDTRGNATGGIGHKITKADGMSVGYVCTPGQIEKWFDADYASAVHAAFNYPWIGQLNDARQQVVVCLEFNMGPTKFAGFHETQAHLAAGQFDLAADALLDSEWAVEVGFLKPDSRGATYARILASGIWE